jgi:hypothetical protein
MPVIRKRRAVPHNVLCLNAADPPVIACSECADRRQSPRAEGGDDSVGAEGRTSSSALTPPFRGASFLEFLKNMTPPRGESFFYSYLLLFLLLLHVVGAPATSRNVNEFKGLTDADVKVLCDDGLGVPGTVPTPNPRYNGYRPAVMVFSF